MIPPVEQPTDEALFTYSFVRRRSFEIQCDVRSYRKELKSPGSVRGIAGIVIRNDIAKQRRLNARAQRVARAG